MIYHISSKYKPTTLFTRTVFIMTRFCYDEHSITELCCILGGFLYWQSSAKSTLRLRHGYVIASIYKCGCNYSSMYWIKLCLRATMYDKTTSLTILYSRDGKQLKKWFNTDIFSCQYKKSNYNNKTISWPYHLYNGYPYAYKMSLYIYSNGLLDT